MSRHDNDDKCKEYRIEEISALVKRIIFLVIHWPHKKKIQDLFKKVWSYGSYPIQSCIKLLSDIIAVRTIVGTMLLEQKCIYPRYIKPLKNLLLI